MPTVNIPNVGQVNFPDSMTNAQISQAIQTNILPKYGMKAPEPPNTLLDRIKSVGGAAVQGAAQGLSDLATSVGNTAAGAFGLPKSAPTQFEGQEAAAHPYVATASSIAPMVALPEAKLPGMVTDIASKIPALGGVVARMLPRAATGAGYGALFANANPNANSSDVAENAALGAAGGAIIPEALSAGFKVGNIVAKPLNYALGKIQKGAERDISQGIPDRNATPTEAAENLQKFQEMGIIKPTLGLVTGSPTASALTEYSTLAPFTGQKQPLKQTLAQADAAAQHIFNDMVGGRNFTELEPSIIKDLQGITSDNQGFSAAGYDALSNITGKMQGNNSVTKNAAQAFAKKSLNDIETSKSGNLLTNRITDPTVIDQLTRTSNDYNLSRPVQLADLIADRSEIGKELGNETIPSTQTPVLKGLYSAYTKDIESNLNKVVPADLKEQWANDFTNKVNDVTSQASHPENAAKLQADALTVKNNILGNNKATLKDIWKASNDWHRENVGPLQGDDVQYHSYQGLGKNVANTLLKEQNVKAFNVLPPSTKKAVIAAKFKNAVTDIQPGEEGTENGILNASRLARQYTTSNVKQGIDKQLEGLSSTTPTGKKIPLKTALKNIVKLNEAVKDLRPALKSPLTGYALKSGLGSAGTLAGGAYLGGPIGALTAFGATSVGGKIIGNLMRNQNLIKAYANPTDRMAIIQKMLRIAPLTRTGQFIDRQNLPAPAAYMVGQPNSQ